MASWTWALYSMLTLLLSAIAIYTHTKLASFSLPISTFISLLTILLPLIAFLNTFYQPTLIRRAAVKTSSRINQLLPTLLQALQLILTTILGTLLASDALPSPVRDCLLESQWRRFWTAHDADSIRRVQDALNCCGFRTVKDMAWPFPSGTGGRPEGGSCVVRTGRTVACRGPWEEKMQGAAGMELAVVVAVGIVQVCGWVVGSRFTEGSAGWRETGWGRAVMWLFGSSGLGGREGRRPLLVGREDEENGDVEREGGGEDGYGGAGVLRG